MLKNFALSKSEKVVVPKVEVKEVPYLMLNYILEMRYLSVNQMKRRFDLGEGVMKKVKELIKEGWVRCKDEELTEMSIVRVTVKAREELQKRFPDKKIPEIEKNIFYPRVNHDLFLNDLRIRFEDLGFISKWVSERQMREIPLFMRSFTDYPDAVCMKKNGKGYFLELEVSEKGPKQYRERIAHYLEMLKMNDFKEAKIEGVIFFCVNEEVVEKIKKEIPEGTKGVSVLGYYNYFKTKEGLPKVVPKNQELGARHALTV